MLCRGPCLGLEGNSDYWGKYEVPSLIIDDFTETLSPMTVVVFNLFLWEWRISKNFLCTLQLVEIPSKNKFTWFGGNSKSKIDKAFVINPEWLIQFPFLKLSLLKRGLSDHFPLLLSSQAHNRGPKPFKFQNCWLSDSRCLKLIKDGNIQLPCTLRPNSN